MSDPVVLFVVGEPGVGKTSLVRALLDHLDPEQTRFLLPKPKWTAASGRFAAAGHYTGGKFDGADTVPYNGVEAALDYWAGPLNDAVDVPVTIFDGDRFSHESAVRFFDRTSTRGQARPGPDVSVRVALVTAAPGVAAARRRARGGEQNASWVAGRATKARRFAESWLPSTRLDATRPTPELVADLLNWVKKG